MMAYVGEASAHPWLSHCCHYRFDPVRNAEKYPTPSAVISGRREKVVIAKENNFKQAGERFRSFDPARQVSCNSQQSLIQ